MIHNPILLKLEEINITLSPEELKTMLDAFTIEHLKKGEFFLKQGDKNEAIGFLTKGSLYAYSIDKDGYQKVNNFYYPVENAILFNYDCYYHKKPSTLYIECYTPCVFYAITRSKIIDLCNEFAPLLKLEEEVLKTNLQMAVQKANILQSDSNVDKVKILQQYYTQVFSYFPYSYIASYLGIHRNTFNRIFKQI